jgi:hypothetical protein
VKEKWEIEGRALIRAAEEKKCQESIQGEEVQRNMVYAQLGHHMSATGFDTCRLFDCDGVAKVRNLCEFYNEELQFIGKSTDIFSIVEEVLFMVSPFGIGRCDRAMILKSSRTSALILCAFTKCYLYHGDGPFQGIALDLVAVVKSKIPVSEGRVQIERKKSNLCGGEVEWTQVPSPPHSLSGMVTNNFSWVSTWLTAAVEVAVVPTKDVFYHTGSASSIKKSMGYVGP